VVKHICKCYALPFYQLYVHFMKTVRSSTNKTGHPHTTTKTYRAFLDENLQGHWIGWRGTFEFRPRSPDLTPLDFYFWGTLKDVVYRTKSATLGELRAEIRAACAAIPKNTLTEVVQSTARCCNRCLAANSNHFEQLH